MIEQLLLHSKENKLSHIPSALSMLDYVDVLFSKKIIKPYDAKIVLGKPFGSQTYYLIWKKNNYIQNVKNLNVGVKHDEIEFVDFSEETMGNALGVAAGIAFSCNNTVWVNLSDGSLQMGSTLEAIQYIGHNKIKNIFLTIDYNNTQCTDYCSNLIDVEPLINFFKGYKWDVNVVDGHNKESLEMQFKDKIDNNKPTVFFCKTTKGKGVDYMEKDPIYWHYKTIDE